MTDHSRLRVAFLGNMNNNHFALARYLRARGFDCELLPFDVEFDHFHPRADSFDTSYMAWTRRLSWGSEGGVARTSAGTICAELEGYDVYVGTGYAPAYLHKAGLRLDVLDPYGYDIWTATSFRFSSPHYLARHVAAVVHQRRGIREARIVHFPVTNPMYEERIERLAPDAVRWSEGVPMVFAPAYEAASLEEMRSRTHWGHEFARIRDSSDLMVAAHGRHVWDGSHNPNAKGNDRLLEGWALFCARRPDLRNTLVLVEYGEDVEKSKAFIRQLRIESSVVWLPQMYRKDIMVGLFMADLVAAEFVHSWNTGGVVFEALAASKPILAHRAKGDGCRVLYPLYNANTPETIARRLEEYVADPEAGREMGRFGRQWYEEHVVSGAVERYCDFLEARAAELGKTARR
jgi:glycosyltransferase involved in cell wall biosynthesis